MIRRFVVWAGVLGWLVCAGAWAETADTPQTQWAFGPEIYYFHYREPAVDVTFEGPMYGLVGSFTHRRPNRLVLRADGRGAWGQVDYSSRDSGTLNNIDDWTLEGRLAVGYDLPLNARQRVTPFAGIGYRYLNDDSAGMTTSTGAVGYERESHYLYSPLGVEFHTPLKEGWTLAVSAEYDLFWKGTQESHLDDADPALNTLSNDQTRGYGLRGGVTVQKTGERFDVAFGPYARWWSIKDSKNANITASGVIIGYGYEPRNQTLEVGGNFTFRF